MTDSTDDLQRRRILRLATYDYAKAGAYFVTICTHGKECLLGDVVNDEMVLHDAGRIVAAAWHNLPQHYGNTVLDTFVVMPNHVHGVLFIGPTVTDADAPGAASRHGLPEILRAFKTFSSRRINEARGTPGATVWQRSYYDHIIRNETSLTRIREYIIRNPLQWSLDRENPAYAVRRQGAT